MTNMKQQLYAALHHEDPAVKRFALQSIKDKGFAEIGLISTVIDELEKMKKSDEVYLLPFIDGLPMSDDEVGDLIRQCRAEKDLEIKAFYSSALINLPSDQLFLFRDQMKGLIPTSILKQVEHLMKLNVDEISSEFEAIIEELEEKQIDPDLYERGKRYANRLIDCGVVNAQSVVRQLEHIEIEDGLIMYQDAYTGYMARGFG